MQIVYSDAISNIPIWYHFLQTFYQKDLEQISRDYPKNHSLYINYSDIKKLGEQGNTLSYELREYPIKVFEDIRDLIINYNLIKTEDGTVPQNLNIRFKNLPEKIAIHDVNAINLNRFISVKGLICKISAVHPRIFEAIFRCPAGHVTVKKQTNEKIKEPDRCTIKDCNYKEFELITNRSTYVDYRKIAIEENPDDIPNGILLRPLDVHISDDISGNVKEGDQVIINGILRCEIDNKTNTTIDIDYFLEANSIEIIH